MGGGISKEAAISRDMLEYYKPPTGTRRYVAPRNDAQMPTRGTCKSDYPTEEIMNNILYRPNLTPSKYMYFTQFKLICGDGETWEVMDDYTPLEYRLIKYAIDSGIPILGTLYMHDISKDEAHRIAYLLRLTPGGLETVLFEPYDTTTDIMSVDEDAAPVSRQWADVIGQHFVELYNSAANNELIDYEHRKKFTALPTLSVVPMGINLQTGEVGLSQKCTFWSLVFLSFLRDFEGDLRTATRVEFERGIYQKILDEMFSEDGGGMARLWSRTIAGTQSAGRRKTFKNRIRSSHNVRRSAVGGVPRVQRRVRSRFRHRRRRV